MVTINAEKAMKLLGIANYQVMELEDNIQILVDKYNGLLEENQLLNKQIEQLTNNVQVAINQVKDR